jgi:hypothetical protein
MTHELRRIVARHLVLVIGLALGALVMGVGPGGVVLGGAVIALSVWLYGTMFEMVVGAGRRRLAIVLLFAKLAAVLGLGWLAFASGRGRPDPLGFALGVTCFPAAVVWDAVRGRKG